jgi:hypothetical protein
MRDDDEIILPTKMSLAQATEMARIGADDEAFENLVALFAFAHGRQPSTDVEAFEWGAKNSDDSLMALGFEGRAGFQCNYDCCLMVTHGPRPGDTLH